MRKSQQSKKSAKKSVKQSQQDDQSIINRGADDMPQMAEGETSIAPLLDMDQDRTVEEHADIPEASMEESPEKGLTPDDLTPGDGEESPTQIEKKLSNE